MPSLSEYVNVYNTALEVLRVKGYRVWFDKEADMYCAEKDGWDFMADGPISLLGLVAIYEHQNPSTYRDYWWRQEGPLEFNKLPSEAPDCIPLGVKSSEGGADDPGST